MKQRWIALGVTILLSHSLAFGQQPAPPAGRSHRYRVIFTAAGGGGGFLLGTYAGLVKFEDSVNSERKLWTTAVVSAAGGAVGGYFLGRLLDNRRQRKVTSTLSPIVLGKGEGNARGLAWSIRF